MPDFEAFAVSRHHKSNERQQTNQASDFFSSNFVKTGTGDELQAFAGRARSIRPKFGALNTA